MAKFSNDVRRWVRENIPNDDYEQMIRIYQTRACPPGVLTWIVERLMMYHIPPVSRRYYNNTEHPE